MWFLHKGMEAMHKYNSTGRERFAMQGRHQNEGNVSTFFCSVDDAFYVKSSLRVRILLMIFLNVIVALTYHINTCSEDYKKLMIWDLAAARHNVAFCFCKIVFKFAFTSIYVFERSLSVLSRFQPM